MVVLFVGWLRGCCCLFVLFFAGGGFWVGGFLLFFFGSCATASLYGCVGNNT